MAVSFKTRKALGKRYGIDPAILLEMERLNQQYQLAPGREARGIQASQYAQTMEFNTEQARLNRAAQDEANRQAGKSSMVGTIGNLATTGLTMRALTKGKGEPFFGDWGGKTKPIEGANTPTGANVPITQFTPSQIAAGYQTAPTSGMAVHGPSNAIPAGSSYTVTPSSIDSAAGFAPAAGTGLGPETGGIAGAYAAEDAAVGAALEGGAATTGGASGWSGAGLGPALGAVAIGLLEKPQDEWYGEQIGESAKEFHHVSSEGAQGALAGWSIGGPYGAIVGGVLGLGKGIIEISTGKDVTVICTELHRQGYLDDETLALDAEFGKAQDYETMIGYYTMAMPVANAMRKSKLITLIIKPFALAWAENMAGKKNLLGEFLNKIGIPICRFIGRRVMEVKYA